MTVFYRSWSKGYINPFIIYENSCWSICYSDKNTKKLLNGLILICHTSWKYAGMTALTEYISINFVMDSPLWESFHERRLVPHPCFQAKQGHARRWYTIARGARHIELLVLSTPIYLCWTGKNTRRGYSFNRIHIYKFYFAQSCLCVVPRATSRSLSLFAAETG